MIAAFYGNRCVRCHRDFAQLSQVTLDHVRPRSRGGRATLDNLQPLCAPCNGSKGSCNGDYRQGRVITDVWHLRRYLKVARTPRLA